MEQLGDEPTLVLYTGDDDDDDGGGPIAATHSSCSRHSSFPFHPELGDRVGALVPFPL